jgi:hypothetical protein
MPKIVSGRVGEDKKAIERNWPFPERKSETKREQPVRLSGDQHGD